MQLEVFKKKESAEKVFLLEAISFLKRIVVEKEFRAEKEAEQWLKTLPKTLKRNFSKTPD